MVSFGALVWLIKVSGVFRQNLFNMKSEQSVLMKLRFDVTKSYLVPELDHVYTRFNSIVLVGIQLGQREEGIILSQSYIDGMTGV